MAGSVVVMGHGGVGHSADPDADAGDAGTDLLVPPGSTDLLPGGSHLMLTDLTGTPEEGDSFPLRLTFEGSGTVDTTVEVVSWDEVVERTEAEGE